MVMRMITDRVAVHIRPWRPFLRIGFGRQDLENGERHWILWLGWTAVTVLTRPASLVPDKQQVAEIKRITTMLQSLRERRAPSSVIHDVELQLLRAYGRRQ